MHISNTQFLNSIRKGFLGEPILTAEWVAPDINQQPDIISQKSVQITLKRRSLVTYLYELLNPCFLTIHLGSKR